MVLHTNILKISSAPWTSVYLESLWCKAQVVDEVQHLVIHGTVKADSVNSYSNMPVVVKVCSIALHVVQIHDGIQWSHTTQKIAQDKTVCFGFM